MEPWAELERDITGGLIIMRRPNLSTRAGEAVPVPGREVCELCARRSSSVGRLGSPAAGLATLFSTVSMALFAVTRAAAALRS